MEKRTLLYLATVAALLAAGAFAAYTLHEASTPVRVGVLLPLTGDVELCEPLEWARDSVNRQGGIGGRKVELVWKDTGSRDTRECAQELLRDPTVRVVIGPPTSDDVYTLAPLFMKEGKILISPLATSGDILHAFGKTGWFWRTAQGDVAQVRVIFSVLGKKGVRSVGVLAENTTYGRTFYDWSGFFATESGIEATDVRKFTPGGADLESGLDSVLSGDPDILIAACGPADAARIRQKMKESGTRTGLFLTDAADTPDLVRLSGTSAEGLEGTSPTADPSTGFPVAYEEKFGHPPAEFAAPAYDALMLAMYISARQKAAPFESLPDSVRHVVYGNGTPRGWDAQEMGEALDEIIRGGSPAVTGASGPLDFDPEFGVDPLVSFYSHWTIGPGGVRTREVLASSKGGPAGAKSVARSRASERLMAELPLSPGFVPPVPKKDLWAVIVGPSRGWGNYRHQADALAVYTLLKNNGVPDDHIVLMVYDDIPTLQENPLQGDVHNRPRGENLRYGAGVDYAGGDVTPGKFADVLTGRVTPGTPAVLQSTTGSNVLVYLAGHGNPGEVVFPGGATLSADEFTRVTGEMYRNGRYRQVLFVVDTCFGESLAKGVTVPGLLFMTGAAQGEPSLGAVYDTDIRQWLSDEFSTQFFSVLRSDPQISLRDLYTATYAKVTGSHVTVLHARTFGSLDMPAREFFTP